MSDCVTITGKEGTALRRHPREARMFNVEVEGIMPMTLIWTWWSAVFALVLSSSARWARRMNEEAELKACSIQDCLGLGVCFVSNCLLSD